MLKLGRIFASMVVYKRLSKPTAVLERYGIASIDEDLLFFLLERKCCLEVMMPSICVISVKFIKGNLEVPTSDYTESCR